MTARLQVDALMHAGEITRFGKFVVHGPDRAARAARSRALRDAVRHGWDDDAVREALEATEHATLF